MRVIYLDGRESVVRVLPADRLAFERQFKQVWMSEPRFEEHYLWMAWSASTRECLTSAEFEAWVLTVEDWFLTDKPEEESDEPDPSSAATSSGPEPSTG